MWLFSGKIDCGNQILDIEFSFSMNNTCYPIFNLFWYFGLYSKIVQLKNTALFKWKACPFDMWSKYCNEQNKNSSKTDKCWTRYWSKLFRKFVLHVIYIDALITCLFLSQFQTVVSDNRNIVHLYLFIFIHLHLLFQGSQRSVKSGN